MVSSIQSDRLPARTREEKVLSCVSEVVDRLVKKIYIYKIKKKPVHHWTQWHTEWNQTPNRLNRNHYNIYKYKRYKRYV